MTPDRKDVCNLLIEALRWRVGYENSNPDVGMGPSTQSLLDGILVRTGVTISIREHDYIMTHRAVKNL